MTHKCENCEKKPDWAVMDTLRANFSFLCRTHYEARCKDRNYDNTHYPYGYFLVESGVIDIEKLIANSKLNPNDPVVAGVMKSLDADLKSAVADEDYESAKEIRNTIKRYEKEIK